MEDARQPRVADAVTVSVGSQHGRRSRRVLLGTLAAACTRRRLPAAAEVPVPQRDALTVADAVDVTLPGRPVPEDLSGEPPVMR